MKKTIGLIGGVSWVSTAEYYKRLNRLARARWGGHASARIVLSSLDVDEILALQTADDAEAEASLLLRHAKNLENAGADVILVCSNTTNKTLGLFKSALSIPVPCIVESAAEKVTAAGYRKVGLLGTRFVMYGDFYRRIFADRGIKCVVPEVQDGAAIDRIIYDEFVKDKSEQSSIDLIEKVIFAMARNQVDAVVLACTELPVFILHKEIGGVPIVDTIDTHIAAISEYV